MNVYVLGAGVSKTVGYPLGSELFDEIDQFVWRRSQLPDDFDQWDWSLLCQRLKQNQNPLVREAYRTKQIEQLCTVLDQASILKQDLIFDAISRPGEESNSAWADFERFDQTIEDYKESRKTLLEALETYLRYKHNSDTATFNDPKWNHLKAFGDKLCSGDVVLTFNYDSTLERVLLHQGKWSPSNGYGFDLVFQSSTHDTDPKVFKEAAIQILHLHGALGWYPRPLVKHDWVPSKAADDPPKEAETPAPPDTSISLDPDFLRDLGVEAVDCCLPISLPRKKQIFLHPSFFKDFELEESHRHASPFANLWKKAAWFLRNAEEILIIGYSLPRADSAALTLFLTNCDPGKVKIVNSDQRTCHRIGPLLSNTFHERKSFEDWLKE
jgi:hypothetical protein